MEGSGSSKRKRISPTKPVKPRVTPSGVRSRHQGDLRLRMIQHNKPPTNEGRELVSDDAGKVTSRQANTKGPKANLQIYADTGHPWHPGRPPGPRRQGPKAPTHDQAPFNWRAWSVKRLDGSTVTQVSHNESSTSRKGSDFDDHSNLASGKENKEKETSEKESPKGSQGSKPASSSMGGAEDGEVRE